MKKILLATVAVIGLTGAAAAADLRVPVRAPVAPAFNWSSCYIGGYVGGAWIAENDQKNELGLVPGTGVAGAPLYYNNPIQTSSVAHSWRYDLDSSFIGGGTLGCNWQPIGSAWVFGLEGEVGYMNIKGSAYDAVFWGQTPGAPNYNAVASPDTVASSKIGDWYGMVTGRLGYAWDRILVYAKGGVAFVDSKWNVSDYCTTGTCGPWTVDTGWTGSNQATWTLGAGLEYAFDWNWSLKAEYMYIALPNQGTSCGIAYNAARVAQGTYCWSNDLEGIHTAKIGLNYRFGWGGPVVARY